jgi:hypothetical protein
MVDQPTLLVTVEKITTWVLPPEQLATILRNHLDIPGEADVTFDNLHELTVTRRERSQGGVSKNRKFPREKSPRFSI